MIRIFLILIVSAASFCGIVFLIETKLPGVKIMTETPDVEVTKINPHGLPSAVLGSFSLDQATTDSWLLSESSLTDDDRARFKETQALQQVYNFDGNHLWRDSSEKKISIATLEVTPEFVKLRSTISLNGEEHPNEFFLQWDDNGFWLSQYLPVSGDGDTTKLYRARYLRNLEPSK